MSKGEVGVCAYLLSCFPFWSPWRLHWVEPVTIITIGKASFEVATQLNCSSKLQFDCNLCRCLVRFYFGDGYHVHVLSTVLSIAGRGQRWYAIDVATSTCCYHFWWTAIQMGLTFSISGTFKCIESEMNVQYVTATTERNNIYICISSERKCWMYWTINIYIKDVSCSVSLDGLSALDRTESWCRALAMVTVLVDISDSQVIKTEEWK